MQIFITRGEDSSGPYTLEQVQDYLAQGVLLPGDLAYHDGLEGWIPLSELMDSAQVVLKDAENYIDGLGRQYLSADQCEFILKERRTKSWLQQYWRWDPVKDLPPVLYRIFEPIPLYLGILLPLHFMKWAWAFVPFGFVCWLLIPKHALASVLAPTFVLSFLVWFFSVRPVGGDGLSKTGPAPPYWYVPFFAPFSLVFLLITKLYSLLRRSPNR